MPVGGAVGEGRGQEEPGAEEVEPAQTEKRRHVSAAKVKVTLWNILDLDEEVHLFKSHVLQPLVVISIETSWRRPAHTGVHVRP